MVSRVNLEKKKNIYSWSVMIDFMINSMGGIDDIEGDGLSFLWSKDYILTLEPRKINPQLEDAGSKGYRLICQATDTASDAELLGVKLAYSLLSLAIGKNWGLSLSWPDSPLPCRVIDRLASKGVSTQGFVTVTHHISTSQFVTEIENAFDNHDKVPDSLLLSMELCASSHFESNERSKLIMLMSAFEALANQNDLSEVVGPLIEELKSKVKEYELEDESIKSSILGQVSNLKRESVRRAIKRLLAKADISEEDRKFVDMAYQARSNVVHEGKRVPELSIINSRLNSLLNKLYSSNLC